MCSNVCVGRHFEVAVRNKPVSQYFFTGVDAVGGDDESLLLNGTPARLLRLACGVAFLAALFLFLGSSGAFAASDAPSSSNQSAAKGKGLLSGILSPVVDVVDKTLLQVPVVKDITGNNTVSKVVAPVVGVADRVESTVSSVPVVGQVLAPVRDIANSVVPPVINVVEAITTPVLGTVDQVTAPVVQVVAPVIDPVTGVLNPVVDGVGNVVDQVLPPVKPGIPGTPTTPGTPETPGKPGTVIPGTPLVPGAPGGDLGNAGHPGAVDGVDSSVSAQDKTTGTNASSDANQRGAERSGLAVTAAGSLGSLARYLAPTAVPGPSSAAAAPVMAGDSPLVGSSGFFSCDSDTGGLALGPCTPAVTSSPASAAGPGSGAGGTGGSAGSAAAYEHFAGHFSIAVRGSTLPNADWPMPASMPSNPGATPG